MRKSPSKFAGTMEEWQMKAKFGPCVRDVCRRYVMDQTDASDAVNAQIADQVVRSSVPAVYLDTPAMEVKGLIGPFLEIVRETRRKSLAASVAAVRCEISSFSDPQSTPMVIIQGRVSEEVQGAVVDTHVSDLISASSQALKARGRRRCDPELAQYNGLYLAFASRGLIASDDTRDGAMAKALECPGMTVGSIYVDYWGPVGTLRTEIGE